VGRPPSPGTPAPTSPASTSSYATTCGPQADADAFLTRSAAPQRTGTRAGRPHARLRSTGSRPTGATGSTDESTLQGEPP
jgi:hypothetical protein